MTTTKQWFYKDVTTALTAMQTNDRKKPLRDTAFRDLKKCYVHDFQLQAILVKSDTIARYFKSIDGGGIGP